MISEHAFCSTYTSFWQDLLPMGDAVVRWVNMTTQRFDKPIRTHLDPSRRGIVNEAGFTCFAEALRGTSDSGSRISRLSMAVGDVKAMVQAPIGPLVGLLRPELFEASWLARRLLAFFLAESMESPLLVSPPFQGCGMLGKCSGDVLAGQTLYEVKAGFREFRLVDLRQLLTYCALTQEAVAARINFIGLVNPRLGLWSRLSLEQTARDASGRGAAELLGDVRDFLSSDEASH